MSRRKIFLLYPYYWPHFKAGGPVQSLFNLVTIFGGEFDFYILSLNKDIDGSEPQETLQLGKWSRGPNQENIYYASLISPYLIYAKMREVEPDVVSINGIFHWNTSLFGLIGAKLLGRNVILSPRGMLQAWALQRGRWKKNLYLALFKNILSKNEIWHATDQQEKEDIYKIFGSNQVVHIAANIPRHVSVFNSIAFPDIHQKIKLVFLSLINPNKNLHLIIEAVKSAGDKYSLDIYGPVADGKYWLECQKAMEGVSDITYRGSVPPWDVPGILSQYHFFVLPTQGENFGHAIFDALSSSVPVIISRNTPWSDIDKDGAGFYLDLQENKSIDTILCAISKMTPEDYHKYRISAHEYSTAYWETRNYKQDCQFLFES